MRARSVNENIRFERGQDPKDSMELGRKEVRVGNMMNKLALKYGFKEVEPEIQPEIESIRKWELGDEDSTTILLFKEGKMLNVHFSDEYGDGVDDYEDWLDEETWKNFE